MPTRESNKWWTLSMLILSLCAVIAVLLVMPQPTSCSDTSKMSLDYNSQRIRMVKTQIGARGVKDERVLEAMRTVPRHQFVPQYNRDRSYGDYPLPIGKGQTISQPYIVALMTELLHPKRDHKVLEIGTGSGYQAAVLSHLVSKVYTIEIIPELSHRAQETLKKLGYDNIEFKIGDGYRGWKEHAPFDGIIVTAAPDHIPEPLIEQLAVGGRMVIPVGKWYQKLVVVRKTENGIEKEDIIPVSFVPMTGEAQEKK